MWSLCGDETVDKRKESDPNCCSPICAARAIEGATRPCVWHPRERRMHAGPGTGGTSRACVALQCLHTHTHTMRMLVGTPRPRVFPAYMSHRLSLTDELEQNDAVGGAVVLECIEHGKLRSAWSPNSDTALDHTPRSAPGKPGPQVQPIARRM